MRRASALLLCIAVALAGDQAVGAPARAQRLGAEGAVPISPEVERQLRATPKGRAMLVMVSAATSRAAEAAARAAGLVVVESLHRIGVVAAAGPAAAVRAVHAQPGVLRVDANPRVEFMDDVAHRATGVAQLRDVAARPGLSGLRRDGRTPYDGSGVSIAVIDTGFDTSHEQFVEDGKTKFDVHLRQACAVHREVILYATGSDPVPDECSAWLPVPPNDDGQSGHGTLVSSAAAGYPRTTPSGHGVSGAALGARLVGLSIGTGDVMYNATSALHWVLENHADPCGDGSCPPIRVVNNSYGLASDMGVVSRAFDPESPFGRVTTALVRAGVVVVFAAGNDGGDGSANITSFLALNPVPGFLSVGAYWDGNAGDRDATVAEFSSKGLKGDPSTYPDFVAPGASHRLGCTPISVECQRFPKDGDAYGVFDGTSVSAPYVAGVVAQMLQADPSLTPPQIEDILEDTAHQGFVPRRLLERDVYKDSSGIRRGNGDHLTSFHAGHGLVDAIGVLSTVLSRSRRSTTNVCTSRKAAVRISDPAGDTGVPWQGNPLGRAGTSWGFEAACSRIPARSRSSSSTRTSSRPNLRCTRRWPFL